jgi:hypothetical protein
MNYTRPNDEDYQDSPQDWLSGSLIFARALSLILEEDEGIVVDLKGDAVFPTDPEVKKVIIYKDRDMIAMTPCTQDLEEGQWVSLGFDE